MRASRSAADRARQTEITVCDFGIRLVIGSALLSFDILFQTNPIFASLSDQFFYRAVQRLRKGI